jgi:homoserine dehydrogenase
MCTVLTEGGAVALGPVTVLKFGSSLLADGAGFCVAVDEIAREVHRGRRVLAVVSAMQGTTDRLLEAAAALTDRPADGLLSTLLQTGEDASVALLAIALTARGTNALGVGADALSLRTSGPLRDAEPVAVDLERLTTRLSVHQVVVVPGFVGRDASGSPSLLGRGGSDLTALFLAAQLGAEEVRLVKDVDGVFAHDPRRGPADATALAHATWEEVGRVGNGVVQEKALRFAEAHGVAFRVAAPRGRGTLVGPEVTT